MVSKSRDLSKFKTAKKCGNLPNRKGSGSKLVESHFEMREKQCGKFYIQKTLRSKLPKL